MVVRDKRSWEKMSMDHGVLYHSRLVRSRASRGVRQVVYPFLDNDAARGAQFVKVDAISG